MTIEIRQLVIRAIVDANGASDAVAPARSPAPVEARRRPSSSAAMSATVERDALIAACVREVLRELRRSTER